jgi:hypothetical protein
MDDGERLTSHSYFHERPGYDSLRPGLSWVRTPVVGKEVLCFLVSVQTGCLDSLRPLLYVGYRGPLSGIKRPKRGVDHSSVPRLRIRSVPVLPLCASCGILCGDLYL